MAPSEPGQRCPNGAGRPLCSNPAPLAALTGIGRRATAGDLAKLEKILRQLLTLAAAFFLSPATPALAAPLTVVNLADDFTRFWDATQAMPLPDRIAAFKRDVGGKLPAFYGIARFEGALPQPVHDEFIGNAITSFPTIRPVYVAKVAAFEAGLQRDSRSFREAFPDFTQTAPIYLLHSLGEMDGGTRTLDGKSALIFGADVMARAHQGWRSEAPFFHHELFHVYHEPRLGTCDAIWCSLWSEGLATYVAETLNPGSSEAELLLTYPDDMAARTRAALLPTLLGIAAALESVDDAVYSDLFNGGDQKGALPRRRGYYVGLLVAREIGRTHDLKQMAKLSAAEAKPLVTAALQRLIETARASGGAAQ